MSNRPVDFIGTTMKNDKAISIINYNFYFIYIPFLKCVCKGMGMYFFPRTNRWERGNGHLSHNILEIFWKTEKNSEVCKDLGDKSINWYKEY
jgi:hypothetical protein